MKQNSISERLINGLIRENPTFVLMLGMCPTLAVTTSAVNGLGMGLTTMVVLALSNMFISLLRKVIPDKVRIPAFIVIIASFVTVVELLLKAFIPFLYDALGLYIPLIVVNCIILGRAEAYASKNGVALSLFDGVGMGLGFTVALTIIGAVREILGAGEVFGLAVMPESYVPCSIFVMAPGAFFVLAVLTAIQNKVKIAGEKKGKDMSKVQSGCGFDCMNCGEAGCSSRREEQKQTAKEPDLEVIEITDDEDEPINEKARPEAKAAPEEGPKAMPETMQKEKEEESNG
ncbi:MAG: electron transport complex subunit E [Lachnospiraceae bacterium]|nr:electron transport complex subunit E [Lachnospiraceae bacterium]